MNATRQRMGGWVAVVLLVGVAGARGASQYWDVDSTAGLTPGDGTWNTAESRWAASATPGTSDPGPWINGNDALFQSVGGPSFVTVDGIQAAKVTVSAGGPYTFAGGAAPFTNTSTFLIGSGNDVSVTLTNAVVFSTVSTTPFILGQNGDHGNALVLRSGTTWDLGGNPLRIGWDNGAAGGYSNSMVVDAGAVVTNFSYVNLGYCNRAGSMSGNILVVTNGGKVVGTSGATSSMLGRPANAGSWCAGNRLVVTGSNSVFQITGAFEVGGSTVGTNTDNVLQVDDGAALVLGSFTVGKGTTGHGNAAYFGGGSRPTTVALGTVTVGSVGWDHAVSATNVTVSSGTISLGKPGTTNCSIRLQGGTAWTCSGGLSIGKDGSGSGHRLTVDGGGSTGGAVLTLNDNSEVGYASAAGAAQNGNALIVTNGGWLTVVTAANGLRIGYTALSGTGYCVGNEVVVSGPGSRLTASGIQLNVGWCTLATTWSSSNRLVIADGARVVGTPVRAGYGAYASNATNNTVEVRTGGLLEANTLATDGPGNGNRITNDAAIYQFTTATPTITPAAGVGSISLNNGTIAFRGVTTVNVTNNWCGSQLTNMAFSGANTFRLDNATNAASGQDYRFDSGLGPTNYVRLEMVGGPTGYRGGNVTVGTGGSVLFSNTTATLTGSLTNAGTMTIVDSTVSIGGDLAVKSNSTLVWSRSALLSNTVSVAGGLVLEGPVMVKAAAGLALRPLRVVLFEGTRVTGSVGGWTVDDPGYYVSLDQNSVVLTLMQAGTKVLIR